MAAFTLAVTVRTTAVGRFVRVPPEVGWAISASSTAKGMNLITYWPSSVARVLHARRGPYVMRLMAFAVSLAKPDTLALTVWTTAVERFVLIP